MYPYHIETWRPQLKTPVMRHAFLQEGPIWPLQCHVVTENEHEIFQLYLGQKNNKLLLNYYAFILELYYYCLWNSHLDYIQQIS